MEPNEESVVAGPDINHIHQQPHDLDVLSHHLEARASSRPVTIMDIPDEILIKIFGLVKDWQPDKIFYLQQCPPSIECVKDVMNLRLTCRRFHNCSSHLLIDLVSVELNSESLLRLQEISNHPLIRKGIAVVQVVLHFYDSGLADDIVAFTSYNRDRLHLHTQKLEDQIGMYLDQFKREAVIGDVKKSKAVVDSWRNFVLRWPQGPTNKYDQSCRAIIRTAHRKYRQLFADQEKMRKDSIFVRAVATAFLKMPIATRLELRAAKPFREPEYYVSHAAETKTLKQMMLFPTKWQEIGEHNVHNLGQPPAEVLVKLPVAIHEAGGFLNGLDICFPLVTDFSTLKPSQEDRHKLSVAMQRLKVLTFRPQPEKEESSFANMHTRKSVVGLIDFFSALTDTQSLEHIDAHVWYIEILSPWSFSFFRTCSLNGTWPGQHLRFFSLEPRLSRYCRPGAILSSAICADSVSAHNSYIS